MNSESNEEGEARALASYHILREETAVKQLLMAKICSPYCLRDSARP